MYIFLDKFPASPFSNLTCGAHRHREQDRTGSEEACGARLVRMCYNNKVPRYTDSRSIAAQGQDPAEYTEHYYYSYPVWRCSRNAGSGYAKKEDPLIKERDGSCSSGSTYECALEQGFMEMLYKLKRDYEENGDACYLATQFKAVCERLDRQNGMNSRSMQRMETLDLQIRELEKQLNATMGKQVEALRRAAIERDELLRQSYDDGMLKLDDIEVDLLNGRVSTTLGSSWTAGDEVMEEGGEAAIYANLAEDIRKSLKDLKKERATLEAEQSTTAVVRKNYEFFLKCIMQLPETNSAGMKINVNGLDVDGSLFRDIDGKAKPGKRSSVRSGHLRMTEERIAEAPDYLRFEKGIYIAFIKSGVVDGDRVWYKTNFGVPLLSTGNSRNLSSFLGFRRANEDGTVDFLDECWKVRDRSVCYSRRKKRDKGTTEAADTTDTADTTLAE